MSTRAQLSEAHTALQCALSVGRDDEVKRLAREVAALALAVAMLGQADALAGHVEHARVNVAELLGDHL